MRDDSSEVAIRTGPSPHSATEAERALGRHNVEMTNEEASDLKPDEKALLDGSSNSGATALKVSGQSTHDNSRSIAKREEKPIGLKNIILEEKGEMDLKEDEKQLLTDRTEKEETS